MATRIEIGLIAQGFSEEEDERGDAAYSEMMDEMEACPLLEGGEDDA